MGKQSVAGIVAITVLSVLMIVFSFLFNGTGESNVSLILLFSGLLLAAVLAFVVLVQKNSEDN